MKSAVLFVLVIALRCFDVVYGQNEENARKVVESTLKEIAGAEFGKLTRIQHQLLQEKFPSQEIFLLDFRKYPREVVVPQPLTSRNLFFVKGDEVHRVSTIEQLEAFLKKQKTDAKTQDLQESIVRSWLVLAMEIVGDEFFEFSTPEVEWRSEQVHGVVKVVEKRGDKGRLEVTMQFINGSIEKVKPLVELSAGIRPRCQALRLLDQDPVVREIMRRDILVMGSACKTYLDEVYENADQSLRQEIRDIWAQINLEQR